MIAALAVVAICLGFAAFTGHMWEDYLITFRASLNLATGHGLVFQPGQRVHSFTSPLGTLLPALFALGGGEDVAIRALWLLRIASSLALSTAAALAMRTMIRESLSAFAIGVGVCLLALDPKIVDFSINGMEVAFLILFVVLAWRACADGARVWPCAIAFAGLQWTRPDGCVYFAAIVGAWVLCGAPGEDSWRERLGRLLRGACLGGLLYLPWFAWAWWYYGSPVPHTITAKSSNIAAGEIATTLALYPWRLLFGHAALHGLYMPAYYFLGGWPEVVCVISRVLAVGAALAWLIPGMRTAGRLASVAFFLGGFYVECIPRSPWYYPGWEALGLIAWAYLFDTARAWSLSHRLRLTSMIRTAGGLLVALQAGLFVSVAWQMHAQQTVIEHGHRREIGLWLRSHAAPGDRVYLEPLGYIGYYSELKMYDYPGLCSPEVVAAHRAGFQPHAGLIHALQPEWLVLRPFEAQGVAIDRPQLFKQEYEFVRLFTAWPEVNAIKVLPGREYLLLDAQFLLYHRRMAAPP